MLFNAIHDEKNHDAKAALKVLWVLPAVAATVTGSGLWLCGRVLEATSEIFSRVADFARPKAIFKPYIPSIDELEKLSIKDLHSIWRTNNETLIGFLETKKVPRIGFHGTNKNGIEGILNSDQSGRYESEKFWVASCRHQLDPITYLADLYTIAEKASCYKGVGDEEAGIFTVITKINENLDKYIGGSYLIPNILDHDSLSDQKFLHRIWRCPDQSPEIPNLWRHFSEL